MIKLAIIIPTLTNRVHIRNRLENALMFQVNKLPNPDDVRLIFIEDNGEQSTGAKRNKGIELAIECGALYIAGHDDDDLPGENYIKRQLEVVDSGCDCGSLLGQIYFHGVPGMPFHHSLKYDHWYQDNEKYYRNPNHLNCLRLGAVKDIRFHNKTIGEDGHYSIDLHNAGVLKTEHCIDDEVIYHYFTGRKVVEVENEIYNKITSV